MGKKRYLGGSTIIGPRDDPYRIENTPHNYVEDNERPRTIFWGIADDLFDELQGLDFGYLSEIYSAMQHAFVHGDLTAITRIAEADGSLGSYTLRLMNKVMIGRKFGKQKGKIVIRKNGKLEWDARQIIAVYRAMIVAQDAQIDELPDIHPQVQKLIDHPPSCHSRQSAPPKPKRETKL